MSGELWKPIKGFPGYDISNRGRVRSLKRWATSGAHIIAPGKDHKGYLRVCLWKDGKPHPKKVHRLVAEAFIGECPDGYQVNHKDEDKANNRVDNLEYLTPKENSNYGTRNLRVSMGNYGKTHTEEAKRKIALSKKRPVMCVETGLRYDSATDVEEMLGYHHTKVGDVCRGHRKTAYGYHWRFV